MSTPFLGTNVVTQIGMLVKDVEKEAAVWSEFLGVPVPSISITDVEEQAQTKYLGRPTPARCRMAFFDIGHNLQLELIEPVDGPSIWQHDLDKYGEGFHHIAFVVRDMKGNTRKLAESGIKLLQTGEYTGGRYAYFDSREKLKLTLELLQND